MTNKFYYFPHEKLDCYELSLDLKRRLKGTKFDTGEDHKQAVRAIGSVLRNTAEGMRRAKGNRKNLLRVAHGSAAEIVACLDSAAAEDEATIEALKHDVRRVGQMLEGLIEKT